MKTLIALTLLLCTATLHAQIYREISIPTRVTDPAKKYLLADLYANDSTTPKPVILIQTPYNKNFYRLGLKAAGKGGASVPYDSVHYNYVTVDWRGFYANKDAAVTPNNRGQDGYDIVEWIAVQPWCNGKVGTWGGSALGAIQFMTAAQQPPHLVCAAPFIIDFETKYENYYYGGDYRKEQVQSLVGLGFTTEQLILSHPLQDVYWKAVESATDISDKITVPLFMASGWFDHYPSDVLRAFNDVRTKSAAGVRNAHKLLFGPWGHSEMGLSKQGILEFPNAEGIPVDMGMRFFDYYLRGVQNGWNTEPVVRYYQMGENQWHTTDNWYNVSTQRDTFFLNVGGDLRSSPGAISGSDNLHSDPHTPVPTIGGARFNPFDQSVVSGPQDVASLIPRSDVLSYASLVLDNDVVVDGGMQVNVYFTCDRQDADISARICDVYPDGKWIILAQGIQRLRLRRSLSTEQLLTPGTVDSCTITLQELGMTFPKGHRIGLIITGTNYPMFDINLNNGGDMYTAGDTLSATTQIHRTPTLRSCLILETAPGLSGVKGREKMPDKLDLTEVRRRGGRR